MATVISPVAEVCRSAKRAAAALAQIETAVKDAALEAIAAALDARCEEILSANARDMQAGLEADIGEALLDRLRLDEGRVAGIARAVRDIAALADPGGEVVSGWRLPNGLDVRKVRVPLGVVAVVYEARPNVTVDATALCLKSGNAIVLRGSSSASHSNAALAQIASESAVEAGLPPGSVNLLAGGGHEELTELATQDETVDLIIPRGGERLKEALQAAATVPVIYAASGNCHVYVDASADLDQAEAIVINAKTQRPGVCNAAETVLIHDACAAELIPRLVRSLGAAGVLLRGDDRTLALAGTELAQASDDGADGSDPARAVLEPAQEEDWETEYLSLALASHALDALALRRVVLMPAHTSPYKPSAPDPGPEHRLRMCRLLVGGAPGVSVCALEIERGGTSYTVDTLTAIHASHPDAELTFIVGADTASTLPAWREPARLLRLA